MNSHSSPNRFRLFTLAAIAAFTLGLTTFGQEASSESVSQKFREDVFVFGRDFTLKADEVSRDVVIVGGNATIEGTVRGDLVVVFGSAKITGEVANGVVVVLGGASVGEGGRIRRDAVIVGGSLEAAPGALIEGARREIVMGDRLPDLRWIGDWVMTGLLMARPLPPQFGWVWAIALLFLVIYVMLEALFPKAATACVEALEETPAGSFFAGVLAFALVGPLLFLLAVSVAGIPVIPVLIFALCAAVLFGKMAVYRATGQKLGGQFSAAIVQQPLVALLIGLAVFYLLYMIPVLGFMAWTVAAVWGLGAVLVAAFSSFRSETLPSPLVVSGSASTSTESVPRMETGGAGGTVVPPESAGTESTGAQAATPPGMLAGMNAITLQRAGFWVRLVATILDWIILGLLVSVFEKYILAVCVAYHVGLWTWRGTTIGGIVMGIKVVRTNGEPLSFPVALVRSLSSFFSALPLFIGFFWAGWDRQKQSWHDKIAGTVIVKVPRGISLV